MPLTDLLTGLVGGDVDCGIARRGGVFPRDPVDSLHLEAVAGVSLQVPHHHLPLPQTQPARSDVHVVVAACAGAPIPQALLTHHVVDEVAPPAGVHGVLPLQGQRGLVHAGYNVARPRGDCCTNTDTDTHTHTHTHTHTRRCLRRWASRMKKNTQLRL